MRDLKTIETPMLHRLITSTLMLQSTHQAMARQYAEELGQMRAEIVRRQIDEDIQAWLASRLNWEWVG